MSKRARSFVLGIRLSASVLASALAASSLLCPATAQASQIIVPSGGSIRDAVARAVPGDEIVLEAGGVYTEVVTLPEKGGAITIRTSATLPGRRIGPSDRALLPSLGSGTSVAAITITGSQWSLVGLAFRANASGVGNVIDIIANAGNITIDRVLIEGGTQGQKRGIAMNGGGAITVTRSYITNIWKTGQDSQALAAWDGPGPFTITDNYLEAASENVMFGGADSSSDARVPSDIRVEGNVLTKRLAWKKVSGYVVKNLFELKAARRVIVRNNLLENNWVDGQAGWAIVFTPRNQDGKAPWSSVEDVLFEHNTVRGTPRGVNITGRDDLAPSRQTRRVTLRHNLFVTDLEWLQASGEIGELTLDHNTVMNGGTLMKLAIAAIHEGTFTRTADYAIGHFTILNSLMQHGAAGYGIWGEASGIGVVALSYHTNSYDMRRNVVAGENGWGLPYPADTLQPSYADHAAQFIAPDYQLVSGSVYRGAALDGTDLGAVRGAPPTPPPAPTPLPPVVSMSAGTFTAPTLVSLTASASDPDGTIARVDFFVGSTLLATDAATPYEASGRFAPGTYAVQATATDNLGATASATATVTVLPAPALPFPWTAQDLGAVGLAGAAGLTNGVFTVQASGADVGGKADALHYVWQRVSGDLDLIARVASVDNVDDWTKAGVMIRQNLTADSPHAFMLTTPGKGFAFQRRVVAGGPSTNTPDGAGTAPAWVKLERRGSTITAFRSPDGVTWTLVGSDTFAMPQDIHVGLALSSHDDTKLAGAMFEQVTVRSSQPRVAIVTTTLPDGRVGVAYSAALQATGGGGSFTWRIDSGTLPSGLVLNPGAGTITGTPSQEGSFPVVVRVSDALDPSNTATASLTLSVSAVPAWNSQDIGLVALPGGFTVDASGKLTLRASGADVWDTADALHYVWQRVSGDVDIVARVSSIENVNALTKAGVMIRESLAADSANAFMLGSPSRAIAFQRRRSTGGVTTTSSGTDGVPVWLKLERRGNTIRAYRSPNGSNWQLVGSDTFTMAQDVYVGLALTSHDNTRLATASFTSVVIRRVP